MNTETDFVSRTPVFTTLLRNTCDSILKSVKSETLSQGNLNIEEAKALPLNGEESIGTSITNVIAKLQENISLRRGAYFVIPEGQGVVGAYVHQTSGIPQG